MTLLESDIETPNVVLLRVGIDTSSSSGGIFGPLFTDGRFEYIPIASSRGDLKYETMLGRYGKCLISYFPKNRQFAMGKSGVHYDPEFETFTYGDPARSPKQGLRHLKYGDYLVFYCGLQGWDDCTEERALYIMGYFKVACAGYATDFNDTELKSMFKNNFHVRYEDVFRNDKEHLVLVKGTDESRLLEKAWKISANGEDCSGKHSYILSAEMCTIFSDFNKHRHITRSTPRWVPRTHANKAINFLKDLR
jgi:hypothetical protein